MVYFKHSQLVSTYHVSLRTVHNWIDAAKQGKLELTLHEEGGRTYIANTSRNIVVIKGLIAERKKYRNRRSQKTVTPDQMFYELFTPNQILDMISNLDIHHEIPRQYNYMDGGATNWDKYTQRLWNEKTPNLLTATSELMHANLNAIDLLIEGRKFVNVVDIGPGNGLPVREILEHLLKKGVLHRYIAIDISPAMLHIVERNIKEWFGDRVKFEGHIRDITHERYDDILVDDMLNKDADKTTNLVLFLGATLMNFRAPFDALNTVYSSMGSNDLLVYSDKPDTEADRRYFDFNVSPGISTLSPNHRLIFDLFNIDESLYDVEMGFNEQKFVRFIRVRLKVALSIKFKSKDGERVIDLAKNDTILLWRAWHMTTLEIISKFEEVGLSLLQASTTKDRQYLMTISGINTGPDLES